MDGYFGKDVFKLGFGLMRLPKLSDGKIDIEQTKKMVDIFIEGGGTYFDTAYVYDGGGSELAAREALVERYPRDKFTLTTKLNAWIARNDEESAKKQFDISLERTGAGYFDYYLLHSLMKDNMGVYEKFGLWDYVKELKAEGKIKYFGFSFHDGPEVLDELLTKHPEVDLVQLQINYADWESPSIQSEKNYEVARKYGKSVVVMEPLRGGLLANPPQRVRDIFTAANKDISFASWAIRYVASMDGILTVLSGMSNIEQMEDNMSYMKNFKPLTDEEKQVVEAATKALLDVKSIPCTGCGYCTEGCPMNINIPGVFQARNADIMYEAPEAGKHQYGFRTSRGGKASECIKCCQCEDACPQHLPITELLEEAARLYE